MESTSAMALEEVINLYLREASTLLDSRHVLNVVDGILVVVAVLILLLLLFSSDTSAACVLCTLKFMPPVPNKANLA